MTTFYVPKWCCEPEFTRTITGIKLNRTQLMLIEYAAGLYQISPKQKKKRRTKKNGKQHI